jgi:hypothetical protein
VSPLNVQVLREQAADPELIDAAQVASTDAFHVSVLVGAVLLFLGAAVNAVGIRNPRRPEEAPGAGPPLAEPEEPRPPRVDTIPEEVPCLPVLSPTSLPADARMHPEPEPG